MSGSVRLRVLGAVAGAMLLASGVGLAAARAAASPNLPPISPQALIASVLRSVETYPSISGDVEATLDLGLPELPEQVRGEASGPLGVLSDLTGTHRLRIWRSSDGLRVAEVLPSAERAVFATRTDAWAWDSSSFTAYRLGPFPREASEGEGQGMGFPEAPVELGDPESATRWALSAISPSTAVSMDPPQRVAGRDAYVLALRPRTSATLIGAIRIFVDADRRIPLALDVVPRGTDRPAISVRYTSVSFGPIDPSVFRFSPPTGARVVDLSHRGVPPGGGGESGATPVRPTGPTRVLSSGWASVVAVPLPARAEIDGVGQGQGSAFTALLPYSGPLVSIRLEERSGHSWLVAGLVPQTTLARLGRALP